jgi:hypothetical protein
MRRPKPCIAFAQWPLPSSTDHYCLGGRPAAGPVTETAQVGAWRCVRDPALEWMMTDDEGGPFTDPGRRPGLTPRRPRAAP